MASSGSFSGSIKDGHYKLQVSWTQTQNVSANTSTITAKMYLINDWSLSINSRSTNYTTIAGTKQTYSSPAAVQGHIYWEQLPRLSAMTAMVVRVLQSVLFFIYRQP